LDEFGKVAIASASMMIVMFCDKEIILSHDLLTLHVF